MSIHKACPASAGPEKKEKYVRADRFYAAVALAAGLVLLTGAAKPGVQGACNVRVRAAGPQMKSTAEGIPLIVTVTGCTAGIISMEDMRCGGGAVHRAAAASPGVRSFRVQGCPAGDGNAKLELNYN